MTSRQLRRRRRRFSCISRAAWHGLGSRTPEPLVSFTLFRRVFIRRIPDGVRRRITFYRRRPVEKVDVAAGCLMTPHCSSCGASVSNNISRMPPTQQMLPVAVSARLAQQSICSTIQPQVGDLKLAIFLVYSVIVIFVTGHVFVF